MDYLTELSQEQAEIERSFVGCVMISPEYVREECSWLDPNTFADETMGEFWTQVLNGDEPVHVANRLGVAPEFFGYMNRTPNFQLARDFANSIAEANYWRQMLLGSQDIVRAIGKKSKGEVEAILYAMGNAYDGEYSIARDAVDAGEQLIERIQDGNTSIPYGIESVDWATGGPEIGTCTILAGRTSMGKTALALQFAEYQALTLNKRVAFFAAEMSAEQLIARRVCGKVKNKQGKPASWQDVRNENIDGMTKARLYDYIREYAKNIAGKLDIIDKTNITTQDILRIQTKKRYDVVYVDHLGLLKDVKRKDERHDQLLGRMALAMHELAKNTRCVVVVLHQLNREVGNRAGNMPTLTDLRDSGKIEENVDNVLLLHRDSYWDASKQQETDPMQIIIAKYRDGARASSCYVGYQLRTQQFVTMWAEDVDKRIEDGLAGDQMPLEQDDVPF